MKKTSIGHISVSSAGRLQRRERIDIRKSFKQQKQLVAPEVFVVTPDVMEKLLIGGTRIQIDSGGSRSSPAPVVNRPTPPAPEQETAPVHDQSLRKAFGLFKRLGIAPVDGIEYQEAVRKDWD
ncbi:hypothetical protein ACFOKJ_02940 [Vogesella amnigena]|uniref:Uncharacterized protein n=1 Tax=Vogesella amnigena TaxID=1507449 RepID=A0ABV7TRA7_9NEIS